MGKDSSLERRVEALESFLELELGYDRERVEAEQAEARAAGAALEVAAVERGERDGFHVEERVSTKSEPVFEKVVVADEQPEPEEL